MLNLIIIVSCVIFALLTVHLYAKWQIKKLSRDTIQLSERATSKVERLKKIEQLTRDKLVTMSYSEQITKFISDGIIVANHEKILYVNPAMIKLTGYTADELHCKTLIDSVIDKDLQETKSLIENDFKGATEIDGFFHFINRWRRKDGEVVALWWSVTPFDKNGICYAICRDVSRHNGKKEKLDKLIGKLLGKEYGGIIDSVVDEAANTLIQAVEKAVDELPHENKKRRAGNE